MNLITLFIKIPMVTSFTPKCTAALKLINYMKWCDIHADHVVQE